MTNVYVRAVGNQTVSGFGKSVLDRLFNMPSVRQIKVLSSERLVAGEQVVTMLVTMRDMAADEAEQALVDRLSWRGVLAAAAHDSKCFRCFGRG